MRMNLHLNHHSELIVSTSFRTLLDKLAETSVVARMIQNALMLKRYHAKELPFNFISFREKDGMISYMPAGKEQKITPEGKWAREGRQSCTPAKFARKILSARLVKHFKDHVIAEFATAFKTEEDANKVIFEIVEPEVGYKSDNFKSNIESCMWNRDVAPFYHLFGAKVLVAKYNDKTNKFIGRAILWPEAKDDKGNTYKVMDRIYAMGQKPEITEMFCQWAAKNNYIYKSQQNKDCSSWTNGDTKVQSILTVQAKAPISTVSYFPYMDTFFYGKEDDVTLFTNYNSPSTYGIVYRQTNGDREHPRRNQVLLPNGDWIRRDDATLYNGVWYRTSEMQEDLFGNVHPRTTLIRILSANGRATRWVHPSMATQIFQNNDWRPTNITLQNMMDGRVLSPEVQNVVAAIAD